MNEWMRLESEARLSAAGYTDIVPVVEMERGDAHILAFEATRDDARVLAAFGYELEDGDVLDVGSVHLRFGVDPGDIRPPWAALGGWADLDSESRALVGKVTDESLSTCRVVSPLGSTSIPVVDGVVVGWVPEGLALRFAFS
jgi:hypothetical protein